MTPTIATILALAAVAWALAWWDIQRRKTVEDNRFAEQLAVNASLRASLAEQAELISRGAKLMNDLGGRTAAAAEALDKRIGDLEKNPATMTATKARMDTLEKAMANLIAQTKEALDRLEARNMSIVTRMDARRGVRPSG